MSTAIYTLSLHDALPILLGLELSKVMRPGVSGLHRQSALHPLIETQLQGVVIRAKKSIREVRGCGARSEEHTSELQSHVNLVCRLLLEKKKHKYLQSYRH